VVALEGTGGPGGAGRESLVRPAGRPETARMLVDFSDALPGSWRPINDGVMGGLSTGALRLSEDDTGIFEGSVSFDNGGGFASVRASLGRLDLSAYEGVEIRVRGDGHRYRLRLHTHSGMDGIAYQADFHSGVGQWHEVTLPFAAFVPTFRGRTPADAAALDPATIEQIGLMIADRQAGPFRLEIGWIRAYGTATAYAETDD
jgi:NADH dehydrogenase [ubiquinone] 1 alpha subcomplex assembly factor 1